MPEDRSGVSKIQDLTMVLRSVRLSAYYMRIDMTHITNKKLIESIYYERMLHLN